MEKKKVLVVDDEPGIRRVVRRTLEKEGYEVLEAADGNLALDIIRSEHPKIVLLDIHMPKLDGLATLSTIRGLDESVGVIMITGDGDMGRGRTAIERGACDYIAKPIDFDYLKNSVWVNMFTRSPEPA